MVAARRRASTILAMLTRTILSGVKSSTTATRSAAAAATAPAPAPSAPSAAPATAPRHAHGQQLFFRQIDRLGGQGKIEDLVGALHLRLFGLADANIARRLEALFEQDGFGIGQQAVFERIVGPGPGHDPAPLFALNPLLFRHDVPLSFTFPIRVTSQVSWVRYHIPKPQGTIYRQKEKSRSWRVGCENCTQMRDRGVAASPGEPGRCIIPGSVNRVSLNVPLERRTVMRHYRKWTLALAVVIACGLPTRANAQKPKLVPEEGAIQLVLLRHKAVRDDLKLTHREAKKIHEFTETQWKKALAAEDLPDAKARDQKYEEMTKEDEKFLEETLTPDQNKRLDQITLQVAGLLWIKQPEIVAVLKLTDEQKKKAGVYLDEAKKEMEELLHSPVRRDRHAEMKKHHEASKKRLLELLTDEQEAKYMEMIGAPFKGELRFDEPPLFEENPRKSEK
jgi:hypothetical protein